ncbi:MAG TPA: carboxymuconolactone decarboxylase family protein [Kofleriaceae bacterium]|nr:carboxymuconolactone decarboxylase family protein [Kofleriaceae bacterium]
MKIRIKNPAAAVPAALEPLMTLGKIVQSGPVPAKTLALVHLRTSQINGCAVCIDMHVGKTDETARRLAAVAVWREAPYFTEAERAALALAEAVTRIADVDDRVPDAVWNEAARHYDEPSLACLVLHISTVNLYNRINVATRQLAGQQSW